MSVRQPSSGSGFSLRRELDDMLAAVNATEAVRHAEPGTAEAVDALRSLAAAHLRRQARQPGDADRLLADVVAGADESTLRSLVAILEGRSRA